MRDLEAIVIGGSAGALDALLSILPTLPAQVLCPIILVLHLPPAQPSQLPAILSRICARTVCEAEDKVPLCDQTIYVAAPNYHLLIERDRSLSLSIDAPVHHSRPAIDVLFASAADAYGPAVAGLLLSGANEDGAEGLAQIRQAGGLAIIQDPATASFPIMPEAAIRRVGPSAHVVRLQDIGAFFNTRR
ncbi:MAG: chemotaxis protein CheB [Magnetococcales bacterium]|nr:chemotaxis protein CheB [Magnetococcales bacterium]